MERVLSDMPISYKLLREGSLGKKLWHSSW